MGYIVGIGGKLRAGKDTVADYLVEVHGWQKVGMSDPLHAAMLQLDPIVDAYIGTGREEEPLIQLVTYQEATQARGYTEAKELFPEYRRVLQKFGSEVGRSLFGENVWSDVMYNTVSQLAILNNVVVTGIRYPNEVKAIEDLGGDLWWVERPELQGSAESHMSENSVDASDFDEFINNSGTLAHLYTAVDELIGS